MEPWIPVLVGEAETWRVLGLGSSDWVAVGSGLGGALLGAIVAGVIAALLQNKAANHAYDLQIKAAEQAERNAEGDRKALARDNAVRLMMRASLILVHIDAIVASLHRQLENANRDGLTGHPLWARVPGFVGSSRLQLFEVSELSPFLDAHEFALVARCVELGLQHEVLVETIARYNRSRDRLRELLPPEALDDGMLFTPANEQLLNRLTPYTADLDNLVAKIKTRSEEQLVRAREVNEMVGKAGERLFGPGFPRVNPVETGKA